MNSETKLLISLLVPLLGLQGFLVWKVLQSLPDVVRNWQQQSGRSANGLLNEAEQLKLLDSRFFGSGPYEALRRLGISSPLFGVAATAILILTRPSGAGEVAVDSLSDLKLLFSGVLGGAVVAITNQICLWFANYKYQECRHSAKLLPKSDNLFRSIEEFRKRLDVAITDAVDRSGLLMTMLENVIHNHNEMLLQNIGDMRSLHDAVMESVEGSRDKTKMLASAMSELTHSLGDVKNECTTLKDTSLPNLAQGLTSVETQTKKLVSNVSGLSKTIVDAKTKMDAASKLTETSGQSIATATTSLKDAANEMKTVSTDVAKRWDAFSLKLDDLGRKKLIPQFESIVSDLEKQTTESKSAAINVAKAAKSLADAASDAEGKVGDIKGVTKDVSADITKALTELRESVRSVRASIETQKGMLVDWKGVLDQLPISFQAHADGVVTQMVSDLSVLMEHVAEIVSQIDNR